MKREILKIDEELCDGCGECIPSCEEGALQIVGGKAKLVKESLCDGFGACLSECPQGALQIEIRDADEFDEEEVQAHLATMDQSSAAPAAPPLAAAAPPMPGGGCPGSRTISFDEARTPSAGDESGARPSELRQWPVQLHLVSPAAPYFEGADLLLCADCVPFAVADFHRDHLKGKSLAIACPKLDTRQEIYLEKLVSLIDESKVNTLAVMIMQVPCCGGLFQLAKEALSRAQRKVPLKAVIVGLRGEILADEWT